MDVLVDIGDRLVECVLHCQDVDTASGIDDIQSNEYRIEILVCALWIYALARQQKPSSVVTAENMKVLVDECGYDDSVSFCRICEWVLTAGTNRADAVLHRLACNRVLAGLAHTCVFSYPFVNVAANEHTTQVTHLGVLVQNMAINCSWRRTKDAHLFQQIKAMLVAARLAGLTYKETPMTAIAAQLDSRVTNKVVGDLLSYDVGEKLKAVDWKTCKQIDIYVACVGILRENLDEEVRTKTVLNF